MSDPTGPQLRRTGSKEHGDIRPDAFDWGDYSAGFMLTWVIGVAALLANSWLPMSESAAEGALLLARASFIVLYGAWAALWLLQRHRTGADDIASMEIGVLGRGAMRGCTFVFWALIMVFLLAGESGLEALSTPVKIVVFSVGGLALLGRAVLSVLAKVMADRRRRDEMLDDMVAIYEHHQW